MEKQNFKPIAKLPRKTWEYARTDAGNAELFADMFAEQLRYDHDQRAWYIWKTHWWEKSQKEEVVSFAVKMAKTRRKNAAQLANPQEEISWATQSEMKPRLHATVD